MTGKRVLSLGIVHLQKFSGSCMAYSGDKFLLISSHKKKDKWVFPKGGWETDETESEAAIRECFEEAGVWIFD